MSFGDWLRSVKVFDESHGSDSFFYQLAALTIRDHEALVCHDDIHKLSIKELQQKYPGIPRSYGEALDWWNEHKSQPAIKAGENFKKQHE